MRQFAKSATRKDQHDIALTLSVNMFNMAVGLLTGVLTARGLDPDDRGSLLTLTLWLGFVSAFSLTSLDDALIVTARGDASRARALRAALRHTTSLQSALATAALALIVGSISLHRGEGLAAAGLVMLIVPLSNFARMALAVLRAEQRFGSWNLVRVVPQIVYAIGVVGLVAAQALTVLTGVASLLVANVVTTIVALMFARGGAPQSSSDDLVATRRLGHRLFTGYVPAQVNLRLDQLILGAAFAPQLLGVYAVAVSIAGLLQTVGISLEQVLFPKLAARSGTGRVLEIIGVAVAFAALAALGTVFWGHDLIRVVYGTDYVGAATSLTVLAFGACFLITTSVLTAWAKAQERAKAITVAHLAGVAVTLALLPALAHRYGILGAAWASTLSYAVTAAVMVTVKLRSRQ